MRLKDKIVIVTRGNKGIGRAISLAFAKECANVVMAARDMVAAKEVLIEI